MSMGSTVAEEAMVAAQELRSALEASWARETSSDAERWRSKNAAWGQCAVTALVVQDYVGGSIMRAETKFGSHYWNVLPSGEEIDYTIKQFGGAVDLRSPELRSRERVLSHPETLERYQRLAAIVGRRLRRASPTTQ